MLSFPYAEGTLPQKLGRSCNHPHGVASAKAKKNTHRKMYGKVALFLHGCRDLSCTVPALSLTL